MKLGTNDIGSVYLGTNAVQKVYLGTNEVWSSYAYLLEDYSGAAAAYSLRKLRSAYTGSAIRVRRSVGSPAEKDIGFVNNELDVSDLQSFCSGTDGFVATWYDQSGNARNATQATAANQPQIVSSGSVITKGTKPSIQFDGTNDELINTSLLSFSDVTLITVLNSENSSQDSTAIMVNKSTGGLIAQGFGGIGTSDAFGTRSRDSFPVFTNVDKGKSGVGTNQLLAFNFGIVGVGSPTNTLYVDNNLETATIGSRSTINVTDFVTIGSRQAFSYFDGKFSEAIVYLSDESSNRTGIETNINDFYSIY
jgi:hypothetical protein